MQELQDRHKDQRTDHVRLHDGCYFKPSSLHTIGRVEVTGGINNDHRRYYKIKRTHIDPLRNSLERAAEKERAPVSEIPGKPVRNTDDDRIHETQKAIIKLLIFFYQFRLPSIFRMSVFT